MDKLWKADPLCAGVLGAGSALWAAAVLAVGMGALRPAAGIGALACGLTLAIAAARAASRVDRRRGADATWVDAIALAIFAAASVWQFARLVFEENGSLFTLLTYNYGDLPLHWTYVRHMAGGASFWPENPIMTGERLRYPLGVDLLTAVFVQLGLGVPVALVALGLAGAAATALALQRWGGALAVAGFLFSGGLAGFRVLGSGRLVDYQDGVAWKNVFLALFLPQRGFLLALPVGLLLLWSWRQRFVRGGSGLVPWVEGALWGTLPLVHLHSFAFVSLVGALWAVACGRVRSLVPSFAVALLPAGWGVWQVTDGFRAASLVGLQPGWMIGTANPVAFLAVNFGLWLPLACLALVLALRQRRREEALALAPALGLFALLFVVRAAPWAWDNTKLMVWCYLATLPAIGSLVLARLRPVSRGLAIVLLFFSGAESVLAASLGRGYRLELLQRGEYEAVCAALAGLGRDDRVATVQTHNHPVALCGQPLVAGYAGHLWSHGIDARERQQELARLLAGDEGWRERARRLDARYVLWGARERAAFPHSKLPGQAAAVASAGSWGTLYSLR